MKYTTIFTEIGKVQVRLEFLRMMNIKEWIT